MKRHLESVHDEGKANALIMSRGLELTYACLRDGRLSGRIVHLNEQVCEEPSLSSACIEKSFTKCWYIKALSWAAAHNHALIPTFGLCHSVVLPPILSFVPHAPSFLITNLDIGLAGISSNRKMQNFTLGAR